MAGNAGRGWYTSGGRKGKGDEGVQGSRAELYAAFKAKDSRFDGRFFVGIRTTGVYCRPVCRARLAKAENCEYFASAAAAQQAGYRPCLMCRPEQAPGLCPADGAGAVAARAALMMEALPGEGESLDTVARALGYSPRHLRRLFVAAFGVTPVGYAQASRLLLAKNLLTDTGLSVTEVAMAAGFGSLRRMNGLFKKQYRLSPTALRRQAAGGAPGRGVTVALGYRPPYPYGETLRFLAQRAIPGVETVENGEYARTVRLRGRDGGALTGWIRIGHLPGRGALGVTLSETLVPALPQVLSRVKRLFDLYCEPDAVYRALEGMNRLRPGLCRPGTRVPGCFDPFEMAVRAVLGQQITVKAANTLAGRLALELGTPLESGIPGLARAFPEKEDILALGGGIRERLGALGVLSARADCILGLAGALSRGEVALDLSADPEREIEKLKEIRGIGDWTAQYLAMRAMGWPDAFPAADAGLKKALPGRTPGELRALAEAWRPWRSYAVMNLWNALP